MNFLKNNLSWIAPTGAVFASALILVATGYLSRDVEVRSAAGDTQSDPLAGFFAPTQAPVQASPVNSSAASSSPVNPSPASSSAARSGPVSSQEIAELIKQVRMNSNTSEVTRNAPADLLDTTGIGPAAVAQPVVAPAPVVAAAPTPVQNTTSAAAFFANAQANLAADDPCGDDLKALAQETFIYFPAGGLTAEDTSMVKARLIGKIASECANYTLQIRGHSDPSGDPAVNLALSKKRAEMVNTLLASSGIDTSDFATIGMGDKVPSIIDGPEGSAYYDRRVDFVAVENVRTASAGAFVQPRASTAATGSSCASALAVKADQTRIFYNARSITVSPSELTPVYELAQAVMDCEGARLRVMGQHSDSNIDRESSQTGRMRALVLMGSLVAAGFEGERILVGAPSFSAGVANQPALPHSRVDFQIILD